MPVAYTPGLRVAADTIVRQTRRLPMRGQVLARMGDLVSAEAAVARAQRPGNVQVMRAAQMLHVEPYELESYLLKRPGDAVQPGEVIARTQGLWGLFKNEVRSPVAGTVEEVSTASGFVRLREPPRSIEVLAHIAGRVVEVIAEEGAVIEARGALVQGIFGVGGERRGRLRVATQGPDQPLRAESIADCEGCVLIAGASAEAAAIAAAAGAGAVGLVVGAVSDEVLRQYVGYDIGVAITGQEAVPMTLIITEGFGELPMARHTWELLSSLEGQLASIDGATQIRAGVIRPEIIVTREVVGAGAPEAPPAQMLAIGARVRVIREPHFGALGRVTALPSELTEIDTESRVRIALIELDGGEEVRAPRANLELIQE
jgi:biotin carboxyl carrier protein